MAFSRVRRLPLLVSTAAVVFGVSALAQAGEPIIESPDQEPLIANGTTAENCQWPTTVLLQNSGSLCSGTLIHPEIVSTAAHCVDSGSPAEITFAEFGVQPKRSVLVDHCAYNPAYNGGVNGEDYAYCKLTQPVYDIPITPPVYGCEISILTVGRPALMVGFGNNMGDTGAGTKRWGESIIQTPVSQESTTVAVGTIGNAACSGDSGGPAYVQYPDGSWHNFGIVSGGPPCEQGADTYVTLHSAIPWIEEMSGVDVTPCHDVDGTWNPTPACQGFALDPWSTEPSWSDWCATPTSEPAATCGEAFNADPDDVPPTVAIITPENGTSYDADPATFDITVEAADEGHGVKEVRLSVNDSVIATDAHAPYEFNNAQFPMGSYVLVAIAEDWNGNITESAAVGIAVADELPEIPEDDGTGDGNIDGGEGCACSSADAGPAAPLGTLALGLGLLGLRRRRR